MIRSLIGERIDWVDLFIYIIPDRKKDLVKLQIGEYVSLGKVETELKTCPLVENLCVYGEPTKNNVVVIVSPEAKALESLATSLGKSSDLSFEQLCTDKDMEKEFLNKLIEVGKKGNFFFNSIF